MRFPSRSIPTGAVINIHIASDWFDGAPAILFDSVEYPSGFVIGDPEAAPLAGQSASRSAQRPFSI